MPRDHLKLQALLGQAQRALGKSHGEFGPLLGSSRRTAERWAVGASLPIDDQFVKLAALVHRVDPVLAAAIATALDASLESLGIANQSGAHVDRVDLVVHAAAEAMDVSPRLARVGLHAALARARQLGLDAAAVEAALARPAAGKPSK
jgi:hypothetical protein